MNSQESKQMDHFIKYLRHDNNSSHDEFKSVKVKNSIDQFEKIVSLEHKIDNFFMKKAIYVSVDDYRFKVDNADGHLNGMCAFAAQAGKSFYNAQIGHFSESFRARRMRRERERIDAEMKELQAAISILSNTR